MAANGLATKIQRRLESEVRNLFHGSNGFQALVDYSTLFDLSLIFLIGLLPLTWFHGFLINSSDFAFPLDRYSYFAATLTWWDGRYSTGIANPLQFPNLLFGAFSAFTEYVGLPLINFEQLLFCVWFAGSGLSAYLLCRVLGLGRISRLSASLFYMLNPFALVLVWNVAQGMIQFEYAFLPLIVGLFTYGLLHGRGVRFAFGVQLLWFLLGLVGPAANIELTLVYWVAIFCVAVTYGFYRLLSRDLHGVLTASVLFVESVGGFALLNLFWLVPSLSQLNQYFGRYSSIQALAFTPNLPTYALNSANLADALRLVGYWAFPSGGWEGGAYFPWAGVYQTIGMTIVTFLPLLLIVLSMRKLTAKIGLLIPLYFLALVLIAGVNPPLGSVKQFIFANFPVFQITRTAIVVWGLLVSLCSAVFFGFGLESAYSTLSGWSSRVARSLPIGVVGIGVVLFLVLGVLAFPMWNGSVIQSGVGNYTSVDQTFDPPTYYNQFQALMNSQTGDFRILSLPLTLSGNVFLDWKHGYIGPDPTLWFSNYPTVYYNTLTPMQTLLAQAFAQRPLPAGSLPDILALLNIKYVVLHGDTQWSLVSSYESSYYNATQSTVTQALASPGIEHIEDIGNLSVYENTLDSSHIYASTNLTVLGASFDEIRDPLSLGLVSPTSVIVNEPQSLTAGQENLGALTQVLQANRNVTSFFVPVASTAVIYTNAPGAPEHATLDGAMQSLSLYSMNSSWSITSSIGLSEGWHSFAIPENRLASYSVVVSSAPALDTASVAQQPIVTYQRISPTEYLVHVINATHPFFLVFSESYDSGWKVYSSKPGVFGLGGMPFAASENHFLANGFANGWYVNETGTYSLTLYYQPQSEYEICLAATLTGFVAMTLVVACLLAPSSEGKVTESKLEVKSRDNYERSGFYSATSRREESISS